MCHSFQIDRKHFQGITQDVFPVSHPWLVAAMTQLSALAQSEIVSALELAGVSSARDLAGLSEVLLLVRSRVRSTLSSDDLAGQRLGLARCVQPLVQWLDGEQDISLLSAQQKTDLLWNLYTASVSRTVLAEKFALVCTNEGVWNETMLGLFSNPEMAGSPHAPTHWLIRYHDVVLLVLGSIGFLADQYLTSGRWRVYLLVASSLSFGLGALLWYYPIRSRFSDTTPWESHPVPSRVRMETTTAPVTPAVVEEQPPMYVPPFPGIATADSGLVDSSGVFGAASEPLQVGVAVMMNGQGPTESLIGQRGVIMAVRDGSYEVRLNTGLMIGQLTRSNLTLIPTAEVPAVQASAPAVGFQGDMTGGFYAPYAAGAEVKVKQQAGRLKVSLEKAAALASTLPSWATMFWQSVKNEVDLYGLETMVKDVLSAHGYVGSSTIGPPRLEELKKQLAELESFGGPQHGLGAAILRAGAAEAVADPEQMAWHLKLPADMQRAGPELYRNIRAEGVSSVRQWVNEQHAGLEAKSSTQFQDLFTAATIIDFELAGCRTETELMARLATSDTLEIHLRKLGAFIYYRRTKDKTGANRMLGLRAPGTNADIAPKWMLDDANTHSKTEYQRLERGQKLGRLEHAGSGSGGGAKGGGKQRGGGKGGGGKGKAPKKGGTTTQG